MPKNLVNLIFLVVIGCLLVGLTGCFPKISLDPESREFYKYAYLIMNDNEKDIFKHLPDKEARETFIEDFWKKRDPDPSTEVNEYKKEFYRRIEYANQRFKEGPPGWKTDRGRIYIYLGPPDKTEETRLHGDPNVRGPKLIWTYYKYGVAVLFEDKKGIGEFKFDPYTGIYGNLFEAIERAKLGLDLTKEISKQLTDFDVDYDKDENEIQVEIPVSSLTFKGEEGLLKAEFEFEFYIYKKNSSEKYEFKRSRIFERTEGEVLEMKEILFTFPYEIEPGVYYFDVVIIGKGDIGKSRKIFRISI